MTGAAPSGRTSASPLTARADRLPDVIRSYLDAHAARDVDGALAAFTPTAEVTDQGMTFSGTAAVRTSLSKAGAEYSWTTQLVGASGSTTRCGSPTTGSKATSPAASPT